MGLGGFWGSRLSSFGTRAEPTKAVAWVYNSGFLRCEGSTACSSSDLELAWEGL